MPNASTQTGSAGWGEGVAWMMTDMVVEPQFNWNAPTHTPTAEEMQLIRETNCAFARHKWHPYSHCRECGHKKELAKKPRVMRKHKKKNNDYDDKWIQPAQSNKSTKVYYDKEQASSTVGTGFRGRLRSR